MPDPYDLQPDDPKPDDLKPDVPGHINPGRTTPDSKPTDPDDLASDLLGADHLGHAWSESELARVLATDPALFDTASHDSLADTRLGTLDANPTTPPALPQRCGNRVFEPSPRAKWPAQRMVLGFESFGHRIERWLGDGTWSRVYSATCLETGEARVLKHIETEGPEYEHLHDIVAIEFKHMRRIRSRVLRTPLSLETIGRKGDPIRVSVLLLPEVPGLPLGVDRQPFGLAIRVLNALLTATEELVKAGLVHGAFKPQNIYETPSGRLVIGGTGQVTPIGDSIGKRRFTPGFSAPEYARQREATDRTDLFSVAATFYTLVTGRVDPRAARVRFKGDRPVPESLIGPEIDEPGVLPDGWKPMARVLSEALDHDPDGRPDLGTVRRAFHRSIANSRP